MVALIWSSSRMPSGSRSTRGKPIASQPIPPARPVNRPNRTGPRTPAGASQPGSLTSSSATSNPRPGTGSRTQRSGHTTRASTRRPSAISTDTPVNGAPPSANTIWAAVSTNRPASNVADPTERAGGPSVRVSPGSAARTSSTRPGGTPRLGNLAPPFTAAVARRRVPPVSRCRGSPAADHPR
jgi:hypothetical protein